MNVVPLGDAVEGFVVCASFTDVGHDPDEALTRSGCDVLVSLVRDEEIAMRFPDFGAWLDGAGDRAIRLPIPDWGTTDDQSLMGLVAGIVDLVSAGRNVLVHCGGGIGRAGVVTTLVLVSLGWKLPDAAEHVRLSRPGAGPDSDEQRDQLERLGLAITA